MSSIALHGNPGSNGKLLKNNDLTGGAMAMFRQLAKPCTKYFRKASKIGRIDVPPLRSLHLPSWVFFVTMWRYYLEDAAFVLNESASIGTFLLEFLAVQFPGLDGD